MRQLTLVALVLLSLLRQPTSPAVAITDIAIVDAAKGAVLRGRTVVVRGGRIADIGLAGAIRMPGGTRVVDGSGKFLIPGLWDMHSHAVTFGPTSLALYLANGVTGIRDMGAERFAEAKAWRDRIAAGTLEGPRMRIASPVVENARWLSVVREMNERAGTRWTLHERVGPASPAEAVRWVDSLAALGPDHIKVRNWPAPEIGRALVDRARQRGLPVFAHANEPFPRSGIATLEHQVWPPMADSEDRASLWRHLAKSGVAFVPTIVTAPARLDSPEALIQRLDNAAIPYLEYVPVEVRERWRDQLRQFQQERPMDWSAVHRAAIRDVGEMRRAGVLLLPGTDTGAPLVVPGFSLHAELERLVRLAGLTPAQTLEAATIGSARVAGLGDALGLVEVGRIADLVVLEANPLVDIANTKRIAAVVASGRLLDRAALDRLLRSAAAARHK